jgi:hypothetical protein
MNFDYMVAYLSGDKAQALKIAVDLLCELEVVSARQYTSAEVV